MPRISRLQGGLTRAAQSASISPAPLRTPFQAFTTTSPSNAGIREKLWKGDAPGAKDPYTENAPEPKAEDIVKEAPKMSRRQHYIASSPLIVPQLRTEAPTEQQAEANPMYEPAKTMEDLDEIAPLKEWWEQPGHWGDLNKFRGFAPKAKTESKEVVEVYLRRTVAEVLALREAGKLAEWCKQTRRPETPLNKGAKTWPPPPEGHLGTRCNKFEINDGVTAVKYGERIIEDLEQPPSDKGWGKIRRQITEDRAKKMLQTSLWDAGDWKDLRLDDELKFAIRKRLFQFTGNYIPDARLGAVTTVKHLLMFGTMQPKPTKLAEELDQKNLFDDLANVRRQDTRMRQIQKETEVGRWKVIEEELEKRGLPATGTKDLPGNRESRRLRGVQ